MPPDVFMASGLVGTICDATPASYDNGNRDDGRPESAEHGELGGTEDRSGAGRSTATPGRCWPSATRWAVAPVFESVADAIGGTVSVADGTGHRHRIPEKRQSSYLKRRNYRSE